MSHRRVLLTTNVGAGELRNNARKETVGRTPDCDRLFISIVDTERVARSTVSREAFKHQRRIGLVAHDNKKADQLEWAAYNRHVLREHDLFATGTTGRLIHEQLNLPVTLLQSGPLGGDQQLGARTTDGLIDLILFFWDPLEPQPHDPDVRALLRVAVVWKIPIACNRATADFVNSSPLLDDGYTRYVPDYDDHLSRTTISEAALAGTYPTSASRPSADQRRIIVCVFSPSEGPRRRE